MLCPTTLVACVHVYRQAAEASFRLNVSQARLLERPPDGLIHHASVASELFFWQINAFHFASEGSIDAAVASVHKPLVAIASRSR